MCVRSGRGIYISGVRWRILVEDSINREVFLVNKNEIFIVL